MERQVEHLVRLVDDLLDVAGSPAARSSSAKERLDLPGGRRHAVETSRPLIEAGRHRLELIGCRPGPSGWTATRRGWPRSSPTCSTTPPSTPTAGGRIALAVERQGRDEAVIRVRDNGVGHPRRHAAPASSTCSRRWTGRSDARRAGWASA